MAPPQEESTTTTSAAPSENTKQQERKEAKDFIYKHSLDQSNPKHAGTGVVHGVSNVLRGAVGAVGVLVLEPTIGATEGASKGGFLGGLFGLTEGTVRGVAGGIGMVLGGAVSGVSQVARGIVNTPAAVMGPHQGKWWNVLENKWVRTDLKEDYEAISDLPFDDSDLIGELQTELDEGVATQTTSENGEEVSYYNILGVSVEAEPSIITRRYYLLAKEYHFENADEDSEAATKFEQVSEAYQVLSDSQLRELYDREGKSGLEEAGVQVGGMPKMAKILFEPLFASTKFEDFVGRLALTTSATVGDSSKISVETARQLQHRRVVRLAHKFSEKLESWASQDYDLAKTVWATESAELAESQFDVEMLHLIGKVYQLCAIQFLGNVDHGIEKMPTIQEWAANQQAKLDRRNANNGPNKYNAVKSGESILKLKQKFTKQLEKATSEEERSAIQEEMESQLSNMLMQIMRTTITVDVANTLYEAIQMVLFDQSVNKETRERRAHGIKKLGEVFEAVEAKKEAEETEYWDASVSTIMEAIARMEAEQKRAASLTSCEADEPSA